MKSLLFIFIFFVFIVSIFTPVAPAYAISDDGNGDCSEGTVKSVITKKCVPKFTPLVGIPLVDTTNADTTLADYINALYLASISIAAFLAVLKIIFAGVKYMLSDVVTTKADAKKDIRGALIGLLIVVGAVLILNTVNPQLTGLNALDNIVGVDLELEDTILPTNNPATFCARLDTNDSCMQSSCISRDWIRAITGNEETGSGQELFSLCQETCRSIDGLYIGSSGKPRCYYSNNKYTELTQPEITFDGTVIDTSIVYTINDPDDLVVNTYNLTNITNGDEVTIVGVNYPFLIIQTSSGEIIETGIGCRQIKPAIIDRCESP